MSATSIVFRVAEAVRRQERTNSMAIGNDTLDATDDGWDAFHGVFAIAVNPHPQFYCDTTGKTIAGKGRAS